MSRHLMHSPVPSSKIHVFLGNEAADADSIVKKKQQHAKTLHVPVVPIPRNELFLRRDVVALLSGLEIDTDALVFVNEFPWTLNVRMKLTLLDHNAFSNKNVPERQDMQVVEIIDHHVDMDQHLTARKIDVAFADGKALVASTCTLVAERLENVEQHCAYKVVSTMLLGVIALDSVNFDPSAKKVTPRDVNAAQKLEETAFGKKEELFRWLQAEKFNADHWRGLTLKNCLQVDFKEFVFVSSDGVAKKFGISTVLFDLKAFVHKADNADILCKELSAYCKENDVDFLVVMAMFMTSDGRRQRQILFFHDDGDDAKKCAALLSEEGSLQLNPLQLPETHQHAHVAAFNQLNTSASRKQIAPLILRALANYR
ncbi:hypothetical protein PsorP6_019138 [Peronosclerospora sorghi]|nr:hypothetical protein PsorP6_019138 [Peronosclerospora sorghi]